MVSVVAKVNIGSQKTSTSTIPLAVFVIMVINKNAFFSETPFPFFFFFFQQSCWQLLQQSSVYMTTLLLPPRSLFLALPTHRRTISLLLPYRKRRQNIVKNLMQFWDLLVFNGAAIDDSILSPIPSKIFYLFLIFNTAFRLQQFVIFCIVTLYRYLPFHPPGCELLAASPGSFKIDIFSNRHRF